MDGLAFPSENFQALSIIGVVTAASSPWTWMGFLLITLLTWKGSVFITLLRLWGWKAVHGFNFAFTCWGKHGQVQVMLQSFSSLPSSCNSNCTTAKKNSTAFADACGNMRMDDLHLPTYRGESLNERGICTRTAKKKSNSCSTIVSLALWNSVEGMDNCIEAGSSCFLDTKMLFTIEKSSTLSVVKSLPPSASLLRFAEKELESPSSHHKKDCPPRSLSRLPEHEQHCETEDSARNEYRSIDEPMQEGRGKITFSSDFLYDMECKEKCKGSLFKTEGEGGGRQLGPCLLDNCVDLGVWRRVESFDTQFGWDRLQSLRLGYDWNWNRYTGRLGMDKYSKYLVRDINFPKVLDSPKRSLLKLLSLQEDVVSSVEIALNAGLSCTCTISDNSTVRLWDIEVGKCLNKMEVNDYATVGSHIENSTGFLLSTIMTREETGSLFVWDPRDFPNPLNFSVGIMLTFHSVQLSDCNEICVSDCFNDRLFDLRMIGASPVEVSSPAKLSSSFTKEGTAISKENGNPLEDLNFFSHDEDDDELYESDYPGVVDSENSCRSCLIEPFVGALHGWCTLIS